LPVHLRRHRRGLHRQRRHRFRSVCRRLGLGVYNATVSLINRSDARLRQVCPRACIYHRSSIGLPLRRPFRP
jgi:hypothetical protein